MLCSTTRISLLFTLKCKAKKKIAHIHSALLLSWQFICFTPSLQHHLYMVDYRKCKITREWCNIPTLHYYPFLYFFEIAWAYIISSTLGFFDVSWIFVVVVFASVLSFITFKHVFIHYIMVYLLTFIYFCFVVAASRGWCAILDTNGNNDYNIVLVGI